VPLGRGTPRGIHPLLVAQLEPYDCQVPPNEEAENQMTEKSYEAPSIKVLGGVADLTQMAKPGIYFDFPGSAEGSTVPPAPGAPGTVS
jgi:hypothetical protein